MSTFQDLERAIAALPDELYRVANSHQAPATEAELMELESRLGQPIPKELRAFYAAWGGLVVEVVASVWPRPEEFDVLPMWRFQYGFHVLGVGAAFPKHLSVNGALTPELLSRRWLPVSRRVGANFLGVIADGEAGHCELLGTDFEPIQSRDAIDLILYELEALAEGVERLRAAAEPADRQMARGRAASWEGPAASTAVDNLAKRPAAELIPHLPELTQTLLASGAHSMGCLAIIAASGPEGFRTVEDRVYAHFGEDDDPYVIELLGQVGATSEKALEIYRAGLTSQDSEVLEYTIAALHALAERPELRALRPALEQRFSAPFNEEIHRFKVMGLLGLLGAPGIEEAMRSALSEVDDDGFENLTWGLSVFPLAGTPLAGEFLARFKRMDTSKATAFNVIDNLLALGVEDPAAMASVARSFVSRGGYLGERAKAMLERWPNA